MKTFITIKTLNFNTLKYQFTDSRVQTSEIIEQNIFIIFWTIWGNLLFPN